MPWPNAPGALGETGNSGMVTGCKATPGCIAYVGISYQTQALQAGLGYAALQNAKGQYVLPTAASITAEAAALHQEDAGQRHHLADLRPGQRRLPDRQLRVRHRVRPTSRARATAKAIRSVLEWAINRRTGTRPRRTCRR